MRLTWCMMMAVLALATTIHGNDLGCPDDVVRRLQDTDWLRCNEENKRKLEEIQNKSLDRDEQVNQVCCVLSDTTTCWVDSLRSVCGDEAAHKLIKTSKFQGDCSSWTYPESISKCHHVWYAKWWFVTIVALLAIIIIAVVVIAVLRKRARRS